MAKPHTYIVTLELSQHLYQSVSATAKREGITIPQVIEKRISDGVLIRTAMKKLRIFKDRFVGIHEGAGIIISAINQMVMTEQRNDKWSEYDGVNRIRTALGKLTGFTNVSIEHNIEVLVAVLDERVKEERAGAECLSILKCSNSTSDTQPKKEQD